VEFREREKGKKNDRVSVILHNITCEGCNIRGYKEVY
jgi:hypothetical protein